MRDPFVFDRDPWILLLPFSMARLRVRESNFGNRIYALRKIREWVTVNVDKSRLYTVLLKCAASLVFSGFC
jgi:hypothetical protein